MYILSIMFENPDLGGKQANTFVCVTIEGTKENERLKNIIKDNRDKQRSERLNEFLKDTGFKDEDILFYDFDVKDICDIRRRLEYIMDMKITCLWQMQYTMSDEDARELYKKLKERIEKEGGNYEELLRS